MFTTLRQTRPTSARVVVSLVSVAVALTAGVVFVSPVQAASVQVGYRDFSYGTSVTAPTGQKPESKLWYTQDNVWWGSMFNTASKKFEIYMFNASSQSWSTTGVEIDSRRVSEADVLYNSDKLYVVSHVKDTKTASDLTMKFSRYTYASGRWTPDVGFPVNVANINPETAVLDRDTTGTLWITWTEPNAAGGRKVRIAHSTTDAAHWSAPYDLPVPEHANNLGSDEVSTLVAYNKQIGVMWGNEADGTLNFASHRDGTADTDWTNVVLCDNTTFGSPKCPDDHLNVKSLDSDGTGRVFAIVKTSLNDLSPSKPGDPLEILWQYNPASTTTNGWSRSTVWTVADNVTRAITLLDTSNREVYAFASGPCCSGGVVYMKKSSYSNPSFAPGLGTPFMKSSTDTKINNVTSTKQSVSSSTGLLVLAGDDSTRFYLHNYLTLGGTADTTPPTVTAKSPANNATDVPVGTDVTATFSELMDATTINPTTFTLAAGNAAPVSGTVIYNATSNTASLTPSAPLDPGTTYTATVSSTVKDAAGNPMGSAVTWSFTTATAPPPTSVITNLGEVARASSTTSAATLTLTTTTAVAGGTEIVLAIGYSASSTVTARVADSGGGTWTVDRRTDNGTTTGTTSAIASNRVGAGGLPVGSSITVTLSSSVTYRVAIGYAYSGVTGVVASAGGAGTSTSPSSGQLTATAGNLLFGVTVYNSGTATHAPGAGMTELAEIAAGTKKLAVDEQIVATNGTYADSGTLNASVLWTDSAAIFG